MASSQPTSLFHNSFFFFITLLLPFSCLTKAYGREETFANHLHQHVIAVKSLLPATTCSKVSTKGGTGSSSSPSMLPLYNKMSPCSPLSNKDNTNSLNYTQFLIQDQSRVHSIHSRISKKGYPIGPQKAKLPANSGTSLGTGNYYVTVGFGTPKSDHAVIFDTGSDLTWIQCQPCVGSCYQQRDPIYDPSKSSTYSNISCSSPLCTQLRSGTSRSPRCSGSACVYGILYGDQSYSVGFFGTETLTVTPYDIFPKFQFGCGQNNKGTFGQIAGLIGLGRNQISFVSQTARKYNKLFSYCIPSTSSGFLAFGVTSSVAKFTPLVTDSRGPSFYFLTLEGITVGATKLAISPSVFSAAGTIIDSGTVITRLPPSAYSALRTAFGKAMSSYPSAPALSILDTCYDFSELETVTVPKIKFNFAGGTDLDVDVSGLFFLAKTSQVCLAFAGNTDAGDVAIIGNKQQQTFTVVHDVIGGKLGFGPGGCS